jgi:hypothetical protein
MKHLVLASILLLILSPGNFCSGQNADFIRGDCNTDGSTDFAIADAMALIIYLFQGGPDCITCMDACDVDDDGIVNVLDAVLMINMGTGCGPAYLPAPWPACGADPTTDPLGCVSYPCASGPIPANPDFEFSASNVTGNVNDIVSVDITLTIPAGESANCWTFGLCHDPSLLSLVSVASAGTWTVDTEIHTLLSNGFFSEVSVGGVGAINAGTHLLATAQYQILQAGNAPLNFCELIDGCTKPIATWNGTTGCPSVSPATTPGSAGTGVSCAIENATILCGWEANTSAHYSVTFDVVNNSGFTVTQLVIPGLVNGVSVAPNVIFLDTPLLDNSTATGIQIELTGGAAGDMLCIPVGLMAQDATGGIFECCGTEVCVELPGCCMAIGEESITVDAADNFVYNFTITNLAGDAPLVAEHLFIDVLSPPGVSVSEEWLPLNGLGDGQSIALSTTFIGATTGMFICLQISMHDATLAECCGIVHCGTIPDDPNAPCLIVEGCSIIDDIDADGVEDGYIAWASTGLECCQELWLLHNGSFYMGLDITTGQTDIPSSVGNLTSMAGTWCLACPEAGATVELGCCVLPFTAPPPEFLRGDANSDGTFDISDVVSGLGYLFQGQTVPCLVSLDSNDDEMVDISDSIFSLEALFGGGPAPWPPYQQCGVDQTPGSLGCESFPACDENDSSPNGG